MAVLTGITIAPAGPLTVYAGAYVNLSATAHYDDGSSEPLGPVTDYIHSPWVSSTYSSSDTTVATVNNGTAFFGRVYGIAAGASTITVQMAFQPAGPPYAATVGVTVTPAPAYTAPTARFSLGFGADTLSPYPTWTGIDTHDNLVTSYTIDRGRAYELDQTSGGTATVNILDPDGILDPTNPAGPYYGQIRPMLPAVICRHNPVAGTWEERYRGYVEDYSYDVDPSQLVNRLTLSLVDLFDILGHAQMQPEQFGTTVDGQITYPAGQLPRDRINQILTDTGLPGALTNVFRGNVHLQAPTYSPGETPLTAVQDAADGEFPGVSNVYCDRRGRLCFHGRQARFDPAGVAAVETGWDYHNWKAGDSVAVAASPSDTAQVRLLSVQYGVSKIINTGLATEQGAPTDTTSRQVIDASSISTYGTRSWSASNLLTASGDIDETYPTGAATETRRFAAFYVGNYAQPHGRISQLGFRSLAPGDARAAANWQLLSKVDIADTIQVTVSAPGGGGFTSAQYFVEGVHEDVKPLAPGYDDVTLKLDLSPRAYYTYNPWTDPLTAADSAPAPTNKVKKTGIRAPVYHGLDHGYTGPDPIPMHYDNVGLPIGSGGGGYLTPADLAGYLHYHTTAGGTGDNDGDYVQIQTDHPTTGVKVVTTTGATALDVESSVDSATTLRVFHDSVFPAHRATLIVDNAGFTITVGGNTYQFTPYLIAVNGVQLMGVPPGGATGQSLRKNSGADFDVGWS